MARRRRDARCTTWRSGCGAGGSSSPARRSWSSPGVCWRAELGDVAGAPLWSPRWRPLVLVAAAIAALAARGARPRAGAAVMGPRRRSTRARQRVRGGRRAWCRSRACRSATCCGCACSVGIRSPSWRLGASSWPRVCGCARSACGARAGDGSLAQRRARAARPVRRRAGAAVAQGRRDGAVAVGADRRSGSMSTASAVAIGLVERNVLIGGEPGAGKSVALSMLVAAGGARSGRRGSGCSTASWSSWRRGRRWPSGSSGRTATQAIAMLRRLREEMEDRYRELLARGLRKVRREDGLPLHLVVCDELAFYLSLPEKRQRQEFAELLRDLVARGRAAGVIVVRGDAEARRRRGPDRAAGPVRVPAGDAVQHAAGLGHDPRPGLGVGGRGCVDDPGRPARRRPICSPRASGRCGSRASTSAMTTCARSASAPRRVAPTHWLAATRDREELRA